MTDTDVGGPAVTLPGIGSVLGADAHAHARNRLCSSLRSIEWVPRGYDRAPVVGLEVRFEEQAGLPEGAYQIDVSRTDERTVVEVTGGPVSGVIQGVEALIRAVDASTASMTLRGVPVKRSPALAYRMFWTWDHSTHWDVDTVGQQETGAFNPYMKQPEAFVSDYQRMIDFMSRHGVGGVVIYGLLRDSHGGVEAANEVCRYARERGVRVIAGFAVNSYGGIYYEGDHPYNLAAWLRQHPDLAADTASLPGFRIDDYGFLAFPRGEYTMAALSDRPEMERWHLEGLEWLLDTVAVDGINFEFGDYAGNDAMADMRRLLPGLIEKALDLRPDLWLVAELGWDFIAESDAPEKVAGLPEGCAYQFTYNRSYWPTVKSHLTADAVERLPTTTNLIRPHAGSQWNRQRYGYMAPQYAELAQLARRVGLKGVSIFGEASDYNVSNELSYLALARFGLDADLTWERFVREDVEPRLGGTEASRRYVELLDHVDADDLDGTGLARARDEVRTVSSALEDPARRRWSWLEERLSRRLHTRLGR